ncbi:MULTISPECIES: TetR/AcrR family transcriptional regulator [Nonomuraea]|uniref:TetR/AcrR family transcriptional regulator n=2 Tax=Nonomuraea TaxID=83681 RepID=A0ABW1BYV7_9ACTN|nr:MULTISPECIES: TetR/AcrR family transcriptional regulator [Nonomuraea]MDA0646385.1 TetR/AcrR family transcriptional regulator [Nonomuraea ferruginea]TXK38979.1 TetR/AcrR family transcriptional regulator [Nonomuraea sp. C10]
MAPRERRPPPPSDIARRRMERRLASGRKSDARWKEVLEGAGRVFEQLGYAQATLENVAAEVGINRATLYYYVGTKEELLVALLHQPIEQMRAELERIVAEEATAPEKLVSGLRAYVLAMSRRPELFIFMRENLDQVVNGGEATDIKENADRWGRLLAQVITEGAKAGEFRDDIDPTVAVMGIVGMFNWTYRWYDPQGPRSLVDIGEDFIEMSLSALSPGR